MVSRAPNRSAARHSWRRKVLITLRRHCSIREQMLPRTTSQAANKKSSSRIELERQLVEVRARASRLQVLLTVHPNSPAGKAARTMLLKFYSLSEQNLRARLELQEVERAVGEMRSMIAKGLS